MFDWTKICSYGFLLVKGFNELRVLIGKDRTHDKVGIAGKLQLIFTLKLTSRKQLYLEEKKVTQNLPSIAFKGQELTIKNIIL